MSTHGIVLVARQEIRTRLRTGRWQILLAVWFGLVNGLALLFRISLESGSGSNVGWGSEAAVIMFGAVLMSVLVLTLMITPALSATTINGDRERGTLATLQVTRLTGAEIALGKLVASWGTGLVILGLALPSVFLPVIEGAITMGRFVVVVVVTGLLIGIVCALSQGWSALVARSITSMLLSYLTVFGLLVGTPIAFVLALPLTSQPAGDDHLSYRKDHPEYVWWLLAPNPLVVLADAAPTLPEPDERADEPDDPLGDIGRSVRDSRDPEFTGDDEKTLANAVWPYGLAFDLALASGAVWLSARRLRAPAHTLPKGIRVA
ncbi:ABC transporter permease [Spirillospora sp. NPDC047279]|uniref:ABC transporter permease n=1 Tax=Spirillospora sp. NPDC047279 TaxID=3155478 RepID=UPI0033F52443